MAENGLGVIVPYNGVMDSRDPLGTGRVQPLLSTSSFFVFGHSLFSYEGSVEPDSAQETPYTSVGVWLGLLASASATESGGAHLFGQIVNHNAATWPNISASGTFSENTFDPWPGGEFGEQDFDHIYIMPSNFLESEMGQSPFSGSVVSAVTEIGSLIDRIRVSYPGTDILVYCHWPDAGPYGAMPLSASSHASYRADTMGDWLDWFVNLQNGLAASGRPVRMLPVGPIIAWLQENEAYLSSLSWASLYGDDAPHGTENVYFLAALICYRAVYRRNPSVENFSFPSDVSQMSVEITDNLASLLLAIESRLNYYNTLPGSNRVLVDWE